MTRDPIEWCQMYWFDTENKIHPRILLIGDSIVVGHRGAVAKKMAGLAVAGGFSTAKIVGDPAFYRELAVAMADYPVDYICFNNGLHGLDCSDEYYRHGLEELIQFLRTNSRARLIWRNSTPITVDGQPDRLCEKLNPVVIRRNEIASVLMKRYHIPEIDLYTPMLGHPEYSAGDGFHYNETGVEAQAEILAAELKKVLLNHTLTLNINGFTTDFPGFVYDWHGYECHNFNLNGIWCRLVKPNTVPIPEKRWFWRARFFGAFPYADWALLDRGWYVAHIDVGELYGSPESNRRFDMLYNFLTSLGFNKKCVPAGFSRGGLDVYSWAAKNTDKISCLYLDNPVCDFKSWPGGKGNSPGCAESWQNCLNAWDFTEEEAMASKCNPVDNLKALAEAGIPILHMCADADEIVPAAENTDVVEKHYRELGGEIKVIRKPGAKHHPHCLEEPKPIIDFILEHS